MDDTKKALLSIDIDTSALTQNLNDAKAAITDLTAQLNAMKAAGQANTPASADLSKQLVTTTNDVTKTTSALKAYTDALTNKTKADQDAAKTATDAAKTPTDTKTPDDTADSQAHTPAKTDGSTTGSVNATPTADAGDDTHQKRLKAIADYNTKVQKLNAGTLEFQNTLLSKELGLLQTKDKAYEDSANTIASVFGKNTDAYKAAMLAKKIFGVAEISINAESQISNIISGTVAAVAQDLKLPIPIGPVLAAMDTAGGLVKIAGAGATAAQQISKLNSVSVPSPPSTPAKGKARGGVFLSDGLGAYLTGPGSGTSDSINARLSNGESVINARSTQMFAPILSAINQAGGGVAFHTSSGSGAYATGGLFNGSNTFNDGSNDLATTRATNNMIKTITANMPRQVLVVEDVQASLQNKVMLQNMSNF